ncbi:transmembrane protein 245 isoform X2 [Oratosquilla oratoria]|uniref:transmembrane protein 245 isoform X2 n=1 Tax=Oratosquilla oratoria TaxID=337810 RepID=UPI003F75F2E6
MADYSDTLRSPLEQVWRSFVPQGHDQALRNAFYNVGAVVFVAGGSAAAWSVYLIFQPFIRPLLWAVLCGSVLHPFKHRLCEWTKNWLGEVQASGALLSFSLALLPLHLLDRLSEKIGRLVVDHVREMIGVTVVLPVVYMICHHTPSALIDFVMGIVSGFFWIISIFTSIVDYSQYFVLCLIIAYIISVILLWNPATEHTLQKLCIPVWLLLIGYVSKVSQSWHTVFFVVCCCVLIAGFVSEVLDVHSRRQEDSEENLRLMDTVVQICFSKKEKKSDTEKEHDAEKEKSTEGASVESIDEKEQSAESSKDIDNVAPKPLLITVQSPQSNVAPECQPSASVASAPDLPSIPEGSGLGEEAVAREEKRDGDPSGSYKTPVMETPRPQRLNTSGIPDRARSSHSTSDTTDAPRKEKAGSNSNFYLKGVFVACILVELWKHNWLLPLLPLSALYYGTKKLASKYISREVFSRSIAMSWISDVWSMFLGWLKTRETVLMPLPVRGVVKLFVRSDSRILDALSFSVDVSVTILVILAVLIFAVISSIFIAVQIHGESMHLVTIGSKVINSTIVNNPQFLEMLPDGLGSMVSSALDDAYLYGREWIASMVRGMLGETDEVRAAALEKQVVELWDRVYQAWLTAHPQTPTPGPIVTTEAVALSFDNFVEGLKKTPVSEGPVTEVARKDFLALSSVFRSIELLDCEEVIEYARGLFNFSVLSDLVKENLGTVMSVLESVWAILMSNLSLALSAITAASSLLLGGGLSLLNFIINTVVFMSALFYVLSTSNSAYKPVAIISNLAPGQMSRLGIAVEEGVNGVFMASFKMAVFYGMWTWLLHSLFATNIVYIPSALAAMFGAVPLLGTYWAALPGFIELCWGQGSLSQAALLIVCQLLPMSCVDTAIYADIKGGGHPYLTGLAIAGGIFCWGVEGAILGPVLLCILLVATNMYSALIQDSPTELGRRFNKLKRSWSLIGTTQESKNF